MANFNTHVTVAAVASTALGMVGLLSGLFGFGTALVAMMIGVVGGLLPDIDLETSRPAQMGFLWVSLAVATVLTVLYATRLMIKDILSLLIAWFLVFLVVRVGVIGLFSRLTVHRGMVHSVPYMAVFALILVYVMFYGLKMTAFVSWAYGGFLFFGSLVHLLLDEIYSVNVLGLKLKKSSGTAFKFFETDKKGWYLLLYALIAVLYYFAPDSHEFITRFYKMLAFLTHAVKV